VTVARRQITNRHVGRPMRRWRGPVVATRCNVSENGRRFPKRLIARTLNQQVRDDRIGSSSRSASSVDQTATDRCVLKVASRRRRFGIRLIQIPVPPHAKKLPSAFRSGPRRTVCCLRCAFWRPINSKRLWSLSPQSKHEPFQTPHLASRLRQFRRSVMSGPNPRPAPACSYTLLYLTLKMSDGKNRIAVGVGTRRAISPSRPGASEHGRSNGQGPRIMACSWQRKRLLGGRPCSTQKCSPTCPLETK